MVPPGAVNATDKEPEVPSTPDATGDVGAPCVVVPSKVADATPLPPLFTTRNNTPVYWVFSERPVIVIGDDVPVADDQLVPPSSENW